MAVSGEHRGGIAAAHGDSHLGGLHDFVRPGSGVHVGDIDDSGSGRGDGPTSRQEDHRAREAHGGACIVKCVVDMRGKRLQSDSRVAQRNVAMETEPRGHLTVITADSGHFGDHVTNRGRVAEEPTVLRTDLCVQPVKVQPAVAEDRS